MALWTWGLGGCLCFAIRDSGLPTCACAGGVEGLGLWFFGFWVLDLNLLVFGFSVLDLGLRVYIGFWVQGFVEQWAEDFVLQALVLVGT